jgi:hypothetical protein
MSYLSDSAGDRVVNYLGVSLVDAGGTPALALVTPIERRQRYARPFMCKMQPREVLDFAIDWDEFAGDESIVSSEWEVTGPARIGTGSRAPSFTSTTTTVWVLAVPPRSVTRVNNVVVTTAGRTYERMLTVFGR